MLDPQNQSKTVCATFHFKTKIGLKLGGYLLAYLLITFQIFYIFIESKYICTEKECISPQLSIQRGAPPRDGHKAM